MVKKKTVEIILFLKKSNNIQLNMLITVSIWYKA